jgi:hypothetical protein
MDFFMTDNFNLKPFSVAYNVFLIKNTGLYYVHLHVMWCDTNEGM